MSDTPDDKRDDWASPKRVQDSMLGQCVRSDRLQAGKLRPMPRLSTGSLLDMVNWGPESEGGLGTLTTFLLEPHMDAAWLLAPLVASVQAQHEDLRTVYITKRDNGQLQSITDNEVLPDLKSLNKYLNALVKGPVSKTKTLVMIEGWNDYAEGPAIVRLQLVTLLQNLLLHLLKSTACREDIHFVLTLSDYKAVSCSSIILLSSNAFVVSAEKPDYWTISSLRSLRLADTCQMDLSVMDTPFGRQSNLDHLYGEYVLKEEAFAEILQPNGRANEVTAKLRWMRNHYPEYRQLVFTPEYLQAYTDTTSALHQTTGVKSRATEQCPYLSLTEIISIYGLLPNTGDVK